MYGAGNQLFTSARFSQNQDIGLTWGNLQGQVVDFTETEWVEYDRTVLSPL